VEPPVAAFARLTRRGVDTDSKRIAESVEQNPQVIGYEGDPGKHIKPFNEIFLGGKNVFESRRGGQDLWLLHRLTLNQKSKNV
jgi:hypothetical protein